MTNPYQKELAGYSQIELQTKIDGASPAELINMLLDGALQRIRIAKVAIENNNISKKCATISQAMNIVTELRCSLDHEKGGELSGNLDNLYDYIQRMLMQANLHNEIEKLNEADSLLTTIHEAWQEITKQQSEAVGA